MGYIRNLLSWLAQAVFATQIGHIRVGHTGLLKRTSGLPYAIVLLNMSRTGYHSLI
jgi:hypothetical protein